MTIDDLLYDEKLKFLEKYSPALKTRFRSSTIFRQMDAIRTKAGIGVIPYLHGHTEPELVSILLDEYLEWEFWRQVNPDTSQLVRVMKTMDFIVEQMRSQKSFSSRFQAVATLAFAGPLAKVAFVKVPGRKNNL